MTSYRHTQRAHGIVVACLALVVLLLVVGATARAPWVVLPVSAVLLVVTVLFGSLTVEITDDELTCRFGPGPIRKRFPLSSITGAEPARNRWWYGWGIRLTPHGWMFNVSGLGAVQLTLEGDRRFRIGTDEPERLAEAIHERIGPGRRS